MRIAMVTNVRLEQTQGWCQHFLEIANNLSALGHKIVVISPTKNIPTLSTECIEISLPDVTGRWLRLLFIATALPVAIIKAATRHDCEILMYRQTHLLSVIVAITARLCRMKTVPEVNSVLFYEYMQDKKANFLARICRVIINAISEPLCYRLASRIIVVAESVKQYIVEQYSLSPKKVAVVYNGANLKESRPLDKIYCRRKLGLDPEAPIIVFVGSFFRWQGLEILVNAVDILRKNLPEIKVLLIGDGEVMDEIVQSVEDLQLGGNITFVGRIDYRAVPEYIGAADICAGRFEPVKYRGVGGSPLKIAEYIACGRPLICSRTRSYWAFIETESLGALVEPENTLALSKAFSRLLSDPRELALMGKRCRRYAEAHLSWRRAAKEVEKVCKESLGITY